MANWYIAKINNTTHEVQLKSDLGGVIDAVVPETHRELGMHQSYLQSRIDAYETPKAKALEFIQLHYQVAIILILVFYIARLKLG